MYQKYRSKYTFSLEKYDENGYMIENEELMVEKGSIWEHNTECGMYIANNDCVHLDRVDGNASDWIEIIEERFKSWFEPV